MSVVCRVSAFLSGRQSGLHSCIRFSGFFGGDGGCESNLTFFIVASFGNTGSRFGIGGTAGGGGPPGGGWLSVIIGDGLASPGFSGLSEKGKSLKPSGKSQSVRSGDGGGKTAERSPRSVKSSSRSSKGLEIISHL